MPYTDVHTFTRFGEPWMSSSWLSQVLYAVSYESLGWAGPVILTSLAIGATVTIFMYLFADYLDPTRAILLVTLAVLESATHFLARPHMLAFPFMVAFLGGLLAAADRRSAPSWWLLPVLALWANLHGGFVLGLALIGPIGLEALWTCERKDRVRLAMRWALFGIAAVVACCCTPYGWNTLIGAAKILSLGKLLSMIWEWMPANFATWSFFEFTLLGLIGLGFYRGLSLSVPRIILLLGLLWMALSHSRNIEIFAFIAPLVVAKPFAEQLGTLRTAMVPVREGPVAGACRDACRARGGGGRMGIDASRSWRITRSRSCRPRCRSQRWTSCRSGRPSASSARRRLAAICCPATSRPSSTAAPNSTANSSSSTISTRSPPRTSTCCSRMLDKYQIDATLLRPDLPATKVLDHIAGWKRVYADDVAVIHVRDDQRKAAPSAAPGSSN